MTEQPQQPTVELRPLRAGDRIKDYEIIRPLGKGGMGTVYLVNHDVVGLRALKLINDAPVGMTLHQMRERFRQEARLHAQVNHLNVATLYVVDITEDGNPFLVMEYVDGVPLEAVLADQGRLPSSRAISIISQLAEGLDAAHRRIIVHRDLKPANILVAADEDGADVVKIVDFGIAKALNSAKLTAIHAAIGTPGYMSPEQSLGAEVDGRSDTYTLALIAFELLTGRRAFQGDASRELLGKHLRNEHSVLDGARELGWNSEIRQAFETALKTDPAARYASAPMFAAALAAAFGDSPGDPIIPTLAATLRISNASPEARRIVSTSRSVAGVGQILSASGPLIGRTLEIMTVLERLTSARLVTISGPSGIGKTRLAIEVASRRAGNMTAEATAFASLEGVADDSQESVAEALLTALEIMPGTNQSSIEAIASMLSGECLLVLDNAEAARSGAALVAVELLRRCRGLRIIATSLGPLGATQIESVFFLRPMTVPPDEYLTLDDLKEIESFQLFVECARRSDVTWSPGSSDASALVDLLRLTDGIPLAIQIAAAAAPFTQLRRIVDELANVPLGSITNIDYLDQGALGPGAERHRSVLRCLEWSFRHLGVAEQRAFAAMGAFAGAFTESAAIEVCGLEEPLRTLTSLLRSSMLVRDASSMPPRFSMLRIMRGFASSKADQLQIRERAEVAHCRYFGELARIAGLSRQRAVIESNLAELCLAAARAARFRDRGSLWRISRSVGPVLMERGLWGEREKILWSAITEAERSKAWLILQLTLIELGMTHETRGRWVDALSTYQRALDSAMRSPAPKNRAVPIALQRIAGVLEKLGRREDADAVLAQLTSVSPKIEDPTVRSRALDSEAKLLESQGRHEEARERHLRSLAIREAHGDRIGVAHCHGNLGINASRRGDWEEAQRMLESALGMWTDLGEIRQQAITLDHLGESFRLARDPNTALSYLEKALKLRGDDRKGTAVTLGHLGRIHRILGDFPKAEAAFRSSARITEDLGDLQGAAIAFGDLGTTFLLQNRLDEAEVELIHAVGLRKGKPGAEVPDPRGLGIALDRLAQVYFRQAQYSKALKIAEESVELARRAHQPRDAAKSAMNLAMIHAALGDKQSALRTLAQVTESPRSAPKASATGIQMVRRRLQLRMQDGVPWLENGDGSYVSQLVEIRAVCSRERREKRWNDAATVYRTMADQFAEDCRVQEQAITLNELGSVLRHQPDYAESERALMRALKLFEDVKQPAGEAHSWHKLGDLYFASGDKSRAEVAYQESIRLKIDACDDEGEAISRAALAEIFRESGDLEGAVKEARRAFMLVEPSGTRKQRCIAGQQLFTLLAGKGDRDEARELLCKIEEFCGPAKREALESTLQQS